LIGDARDRNDCGATRRDGSSYCAYHHGICYLPRGGKRETRRLRWFETLADKVGKGRAPLSAP
jgi:hypothetical protein